MAETTTMQEKVFVNPDHSSQVLYQLSELWRDKKLCDATIEVGPVKVYVHRLVLLAACPYLLTIGGQHDVPVLEVKLPMSVGLEGLNVFLTYLYDGVLNLTTSNLLSVEKISKILKVTGIKRFCQEFRHMDQTVREAVGPSEQFVSDYSINMTDNNMKIIFSEYAGNVGELKRETNEPETEPTEPKRKKMSIDSLSSALQQQGSNNAASSRIQKLTEGSRDRIKVKISRNKEGFTSNTASSNPDSTGDSETTGVHIKQEPISYSDYEDDNTESYDESSRDQTQTDFVRQAPYNTQAFPDEESGFSVTDHHHPQKTDPESEPVGNVDASQVLQKVVKSMPEMALGLDTAAEIGEDNQPQMFMTVNESSKKTPKSKHAVPVASGSKNQVDTTKTTLDLPAVERDIKVRYYSCTECMYITNDKSNFNKHRRRHSRSHDSVKSTSGDQSLDLDDDKFLCCHCGKEYKSKFGLHLHMKNKHTHEFKHQCSVCGKGFNQTVQFRFHCSSHTKVAIDKCNFCKAEFASHGSLKRHLKSCQNIGEKTFVCCVCQSSFIHKQGLQDHIKGKHEEPRHKCKICGKKYHWRSSLKAHHKCSHKYEQVDF